MSSSPPFRDVPMHLRDDIVRKLPMKSQLSNALQIGDRKTIQQVLQRQIPTSLTILIAKKPPQVIPFQPSFAPFLHHLVFVDMIRSKHLIEVVLHHDDLPNISLRVAADGEGIYFESGSLNFIVLYSHSNGVIEFTEAQCNSLLDTRASSDTNMIFLQIMNELQAFKWLRYFYHIPMAANATFYMPRFLSESQKNIITTEFNRIKELLVRTDTIPSLSLPLIPGGLRYKFAAETTKILPHRYDTRLIAIKSSSRRSSS